MDLTSSTTTTYTIGTDTQTPPPTQPTKTTNTSKSLSFTNGTHNKHHHHPTTTTPPPLQPPPSMVVYSYKECLKNHAASIGGHALDGCGEFMPSSSTNPTDPRSLKCAACGCHRNFHRRDPQEPPHSNHNHNHNNNPTFLTCFYSTTPSSVTPTAPPPQPPPPPPLPHRGMSQSTSPSLSSSPSHSPSPMSSSPSSPPPLSHLPPSSYHTSSAPHMLLALGNNAYSVDHEHHHHQHHRNFNSSSVVMMKTHENNNNNNNNSSGKKRYRTKFSQEQKEKMYSFSEKLGWRMQKGDDGLVQEFCNDIGVPRGVFKVWMHNNKNTLRNKRSEVMGNNAPQTDERTHGIEDGNDGRGDDGAFVGSDINNPFNTNGGNNDIQRNDDSCVNVHVSINGLSS